MREELDVRHGGVPRAICVHADLQEGWIVDTGPESSVATLLEQLPEEFELRRILLTHIHFDHAGATGRLLERFPDAEVWVHEAGAPHLVDPSRLVASATRIYGDDFARLWGEVVPVPEDRVRVLSGGESIEGWRVAYTPGHAKHHVSYLHEQTGTAFAGDVAGIRIIDGPVFPPTPPPDIDRELWLESIRTLEAWEPQALAVTHFGAYSDVEDHLENLREALGRWGDLARETDAEAFAQAVDAYVGENTSGPMTADAYGQANPPATLHGGWARYWSKRGG